MVETSDNVYFAAKEANKTASILLNRSDDWFRNLETNGYLDKLKQTWAAYHGAYYDSFDNSHQVIFSGEQGELVNLAVNHIRNLAQHMLTMITANRPSMEARAANLDYKSVTQTQLANGLLDYYMKEKKLETYLKTAVEYSLVLGAGFIKMEWNETNGEVYDYNEETGVEIRQGDVEFSNLSPFDVVFDGNRENNDFDWVVCRSFKNRFDIAAKYPELREKILALPTKDDLEIKYFVNSYLTDTDLIPVYEFYHKRTEGMPDGRYLLFLSDDVSLIDSPMPYRQLPVYRIAPANILGTPYGYTPIFDLLPIQDAVNSAYSTILTNHYTFGVQNILAPRGSDVVVESLSGGLNVIEANTQYGEPKALNFTYTPKEIFDFLKMLEQTMETISGVNSVARGNPETSLKSGTALALVQSSAIQFMSGLQQSYVELIEGVGTGLIKMLQDFASVPRIASIVGKSNQPYMQEFVGNDLADINRVIVEVGNPLSRSTAGKVQMAQELLQMGLIKTPEQYFTVLDTGRLDAMTDDTQRELNLIRDENEILLRGGPVKAIAIDQHAMHIKEHRSVLAAQSLRFNDDLAKAVLDHINEHIQLLRTTDPDLLMLIKEQPLSPPGGSPANQPQPQPIGQQASGQTAPVLNNQNPQVEQAQQTQQASLPQVPANLLPNPELQEQVMGNVGQPK